MVLKMALGTAPAVSVCTDGLNKQMTVLGALTSSCSWPHMQRSGGWGNAGGPISLKTLIVMMMAGWWVWKQGRRGGQLQNRAV